ERVHRVGRRRRLRRQRRTRHDEPRRRPAGEQPLGHGRRRHHRAGDGAAPRKRHGDDHRRTRLGLGLDLPVLERLLSPAPRPVDVHAGEVVKTFLAAGAGGGYSTLEPEPGYQRPVVPNTYNAVEYLTPTDYDSSDF